VKRCRTIAWAAGALAVAGPAGAETSDERTAASLGLQYDIAGGGAARAEPFAYPIVAVSSYGTWWLLDVRSPLIVGVIDAMAGATEYAFDGDGDFSLPNWRGLNGDREHVRISAFTLDARVKLVQSGRERLDLGLHGEMVGTFFQVDGVRRNAHFINAGPALGYGLFEPDGSGAVILSAHGTMTEGFTFRGDEVPPSRRAPALQRYAAQICRSRPQGRTSLRHSSRSPSGRGSMRE
jgi:hypothetical protein